MKGLPIEVFFILAFAAAMVLNVVMQRAARRKQAELSEQEALQEDSPEDLETTLPVASTATFPRPAAEGVPRRRAAAPVPRPARRRFDGRAMLGTRRAVQDAFVVATILGRCRADEPHEVR